MSSSTEKNSSIGRAVARVRDRYRDTGIPNGYLSEKEYRTTVLSVLNAVKREYWKVYEGEVDAELDAIAERIVEARVA